jgi:anthranilate phosphoribosyltransferase
MDEMSITGTTEVVQMVQGTYTRVVLHPEDAGLPTYPGTELVGQDGQHNARALRRLLEGQGGAYRDAVLWNTAAALYLAEKVTSLHAGVSLAADAIDSGDALARLYAWVALSDRLTPPPTQEPR